ncbi:hypothetical protein PR048_028834 [Dryococelus australis]|uniref:Peptidase A2 domain-containing protein n=1 Tax=Dryococelus australis TaxID=614101 RepID=A0ABQ9GBN4_9NEOP|nr:hypothetical protein PR048_028834 [Dryococelus australis]
MVCGIPCIAMLDSGAEVSCAHTWVRIPVVSVRHNKIVGVTSGASPLVNRQAMWCISGIAVVGVRKKDDSVRLYLVAAFLDDITVQDRESPTAAEDILRHSSEPHFLSFLDLAHENCHLPLHTDSQLYTAFLYKHRQYCFHVLSFGLCNAVADFTRSLDRALLPQC